MDLEKRVEMLEKRIDKLESKNMKERLTGLKVGDYFEVAGTKWRILDIKPCGYVCLSDALEERKIFDSETNNWKLSSLREYLNNDFYKKIADDKVEHRECVHTKATCHHEECKCSECPLTELFLVLRRGLCK